MIKITAEAMCAMIAHAQADAPIEACGYLAASNGIAVDSIRLTNVDHSPEHFSLDPVEQFAAARTIRKNGRQLQAVYHSHPASPARPSQEDIRLAFDSSLSYVIVSLAGTEPVVKLFSIRNGVVTPEPIEIVQSTQEPNHVL
jgi:proteasome lid subunit RPN8/RPN11